MKHAFLAIAFAIFSVTAPVQADVVNFQIDQSQSSVLVTFVANAPTGTDTDQSTSSLTGTMSADLASFSSPFGTAQIQSLDLLLAEALDFNFTFPFIGGVNVASLPNGAAIYLTTFGAAGNVAGGLFDQLGNNLVNEGSFFANGAGFDNEEIPFFTNNAQDFIGYQISRVGNDLTVTGDFDFNYDFEEGDFNGNIRWQGNFVAFATIPEPSSALILGAAALMVSGYRRRK